MENEIQSINIEVFILELKLRKFSAKVMLELQSDIKNHFLDLLLWDNPNPEYK